MNNAAILAILAAVVLVATSSPGKTPPPFLPIKLID